MDISLSPEMERFVTENVQTGKYKSPSEMLDGALRLMRDEELAAAEELEQLRAMCKHATDQLDRGEGKPLDMEEIKARVRASVKVQQKAG